MKTWKDIKLEALGLMFSRTDGGAVVALTSEDVADFVNEMIDAANYALRDLATVVPIVRVLRLAQQVAGLKKYDLRELAPDFMRLIDDRLAFEDGDRYESVDEYRLEGGAVIVLPGRESGAYLLSYEAYPEEVRADTPEGQTFSLAPEALDLVPVYMASRIYGEEDISLATHYLNQYHVRRSELAARGMPRGTGGGFATRTGWS